MIKEAYCSLEVAKLLRSNGFREKTSVYYAYVPRLGKYELVHRGIYRDYNKDFNRNIYAAPTHQMAAAWLREYYSLRIEIIFSLGWYYKIDALFFESVYKKILLNKNAHVSAPSYTTYESAFDAALEDCLKNFICLCQIM